MEEGSHMEEIGKLFRRRGGKAHPSQANNPGTAKLSRLCFAVRVRAMAFSPGGKYLAYAYGKDRAERIDIRLMPDRTLTMLFERDRAVGCVAFSPDESILAASSEDGQVQLRRVADGGLVQSWTEVGAFVSSLAFSPDGMSLAVAHGSRISLRKVEDGESLRSWNAHKTLINSIAFSPDGKILASASGERAGYYAYDNNIRLWDVASGESLGTLAGHDAGILGISFSSDGLLMASASTDRTVGIWRLSDASLLHSLQGHQGPVNGLAFSPDGQVIASAGGLGDGTVHLWDVLRGTLLESIAVPGKVPVWTVAFAPDGSTLAIGADGVLLCPVELESTTDRFSQN
jgi:WD40 repeat protein